MIEILDLRFFLVFSILLFAIGLYCVIAKKNMIRILLGLGILANAANLNFMSFSIFRETLASKFVAYTTVIILMVLEACLFAVGLSLVLVAVRRYNTLDSSKLRKLKW